MKGKKKMKKTGYDPGTVTNIVYYQLEREKNVTPLDSIIRKRIQGEVIIPGVLRLIREGKSDEEIITELEEKLSKSSEFSKPQYKKYHKSWIEYTIRKYRIKLKHKKEPKIEDEER